GRVLSVVITAPARGGDAAMSGGLPLRLGFVSRRPSPFLSGVRSDPSDILTRSHVAGHILGGTDHVRPNAHTVPPPGVSPPAGHRRRYRCPEPDNLGRRITLSG